MSQLLKLLSVTGLALLPACSEDTTPKPATGNALSAQHCQIERSATAYKASTGSSGVELGAGAQALTPCFQLTGMGSAESTLSIASDGTVFVAPVFTPEGNGFLATRDFGETLDVILPGTRGGAQHARVQPFLFMDELTQRLFFFTSAESDLGAAAGFDLSISDDLGQTFQSVHVAQGTLDWIKPIAAPAVTAGGSYPNVLYVSSPAPISTPVPFGSIKPLYQQIQRSRDGGLSWENVGGKQLSLEPAANDCSDAEWVIYGGGVAASDGAIYYGLRRCTRLAIASSTDEGVTWTVKDLPGAMLMDYGGILSHIDRVNLMVSEPLAIDSQNNLYAVWADQNDVLRYAVSRDRAATWSSPLAINAPSAPKTVFGALDVKEPGVIALAYYGGDGDRYHAYLAESLNALDAEPMFSSLRVSDEQEPLFRDGFDLGYGIDILAGGDLVEIAQVRYAPNGDIWAAFVKDMCPGKGSASCDWSRDEHANSVYQGAIARLVHPAEGQ